MTSVCDDHHSRYSGTLHSSLRRGTTLVTQHRGQHSILWVRPPIASSSRYSIIRCWISTMLLSSGPRPLSGHRDRSWMFDPQIAQGVSSVVSGATEAFSPPENCCNILMTITCSKYHAECSTFEAGYGTENGRCRLFRLWPAAPAVVMTDRPKAVESCQKM
jgi:hypothetical protein